MTSGEFKQVQDHANEYYPSGFPENTDFEAWKLCKLLLCRTLAIQPGRAGTEFALRNWFEDVEFGSDYISCFVILKEAKWTKELKSIEANETRSSTKIRERADKRGFYTVARIYNDYRPEASDVRRRYFDDDEKGRSDNVKVLCIYSTSFVYLFVYDAYTAEFCLFINTKEKTITKSR